MWLTDALNKANWMILCVCVCGESFETWIENDEACWALIFHVTIKNKRVSFPLWEIQFYLCSLILPVSSYSIGCLIANDDKLIVVPKSLPLEIVRYAVFFAISVTVNIIDFIQCFVFCFSYFFFFSLLLHFVIVAEAPVDDELWLWPEFFFTFSIRWELNTKHLLPI